MSLYNSTSHSNDRLFVEVRNRPQKAFVFERQIFQQDVRATAHVAAGRSRKFFTVVFSAVDKFLGVFVGRSSCTVASAMLKTS